MVVRLFGSNPTLLLEQLPAGRVLRIARIEAGSMIGLKRGASGGVFSTLQRVLAPLQLRQG